MSEKKAGIAEQKPLSGSAQTRRRLLAMLFGGLLAGKASRARAEVAPVIMEEIPSTFKGPIEKGALTSAKFLKAKENIKLEFKKGEETYVAPRFSPPTDSTPTTNPSLHIWFSENSRKPWDFFNLEVGKVLGDIVNNSHRNEASKNFLNSVFEDSGGEILKNSSQESIAAQTAKLAQLRPLLEFSNYVPGAPGSDAETGLEDLKKELFSRVFSIWVFAPRELASKINNTPSSSQAETAGFFLKGLQAALDLAPIDVNFASLDLDIASIKSITAASQDQKLQNYFDEKIELMGKPLV